MNVFESPENEVASDSDCGNETATDGQEKGKQDETSLVAASQHRSLKHHLLGPSLTKAGQDAVDLSKVSEVIYEASKGSKYFNNEEAKDKNLTTKIERILKLKAQLDNLDLKHDLRRVDDYIGSLELSRDLSQYIVHIDCDAFYAAVEEIDRPELKNVPMAVGVGVLTTCNYEARKYGCRSAMAGFVAKKLCPELVCLPLNFEKYTAKAREVREILAGYDPQFESSSIDEAYMNITEYCSTHQLDPEDAIQQCRQEVQDKSKITLSAGIAPNAKIAKICSNKNKPNGQFRLPNDRVAVMSFMNSLPVRKVNGVGRVLERELDALGIKTCGEIYQYRAYLNRLFGEKTMQFLIQTYLGLGRTDIRPAEDYERKSVGTESTFRDISTKSDLREKLRKTAESLESDLLRVEVKGRTLCLKIKMHTYEVFTRQVVLPKAICMADDLYNFSLPMLNSLEKEFPTMRLRLMGLRCTHLVSTKKYDGNFFKPRFIKKEDSSANPPAQDEWEAWPDEEFEAAARLEKEDEMDALERLSQEHRITHDSDGAGAAWQSTAEWHEPFGVYKYGSEQNSPVKNPVATPEFPKEMWNCPICEQPQSANDKDMNAHIDQCLSRQTIKEAVSDTIANGAAAEASRRPVSKAAVDQPARPRSALGKRKASTIEKVGGRQKKLFFA
jgi:DNA polymerase kappa